MVIHSSSREQLVTKAKKLSFPLPTVHCPLSITKNCQILDFDRALVSLWCHNWLELVAEIVTEEVLGNHLTMMYPLNVEVLDQKLQKYLDEAFAHTKL
jgi:hypothetical protein